MEKNNIDFKDISVVVQGPVYEKITRKCCESIRKLLPGSTIILSTYKGSDVYNLDYDLACFSDKQKSAYITVLDNERKKILGITNGSYNISIENPNNTYRGPLMINNTNGLIVTTYNGLKLVKTKYVLKIRSDIILKSTQFIKYFLMYNTYTDQYRIFNNRIVSGSTFPRFFYYNKGGKTLGVDLHAPLFHMSDWIHFGNTEDITLLYDVPLMSHADFNIDYTLLENQRGVVIDNFLTLKYHPEIHIFYHTFLKKYPNIAYNNMSMYDEKSIAISTLAIMNNFIFVDDIDFKFLMPKYPPLYAMSHKTLFGMIRHDNWRFMYKNLIDPMATLERNNIFKYIWTLYLFFIIGAKDIFYIAFYKKNLLLALKKCKILLKQSFKSIESFLLWFFYFSFKEKKLLKDIIKYTKENYYE